MRISMCRFAGMKARMEQKSDLKCSYIIPAEVAKCQISTFSNDYRLPNGVKEKSGFFLVSQRNE